MAFQWEQTKKENNTDFQQFWQGMLYKKADRVHFERIATRKS